MGYENIGRLVDHWMNYAPFREALRNNPEEAVRQSGIKLSPQEVDLINNVDWSLSEDDLRSRISKI